jgi:hypothetical protein|nr:MAG: hypothetical protein J07AB56_08000 [Candidatus Nanosalinarum sp. J07AB56]
MLGALALLLWGPVLTIYEAFRITDSGAHLTTPRDMFMDSTIDTFSVEGGESSLRDLSGLIERLYEALFCNFVVCSTGSKGAWQTAPTPSGRRLTEIYKKIDARTL